MENISNMAIEKEKCTKCSSCGKTSWYIMKCSCGHIFCRFCGIQGEDESTDIIWLECPKCNNIKMYV